MLDLNTDGTLVTASVIASRHMSSLFVLNQIHSAKIYNLLFFHQHQDCRSKKYSLQVFV